MSSKVLARANEARKDYRWTKRLITKIYSDPTSNQRREVVANLFVGEWTKLLRTLGKRYAYVSEVEKATCQGRTLATKGS